MAYVCYRIARQTAITLLNTHIHHSTRAAVVVSVGLNYQYGLPLMLTIDANSTHAWSMVYIMGRSLVCCMAIGLPTQPGQNYSWAPTFGTFSLAFRFFLVLNSPQNFGINSFHHSTPKSGSLFCFLIHSAGLDVVYFPPFLLCSTLGFTYIVSH